jgi:hypothetical protein
VIIGDAAPRRPSRRLAAMPWLLLAGLVVGRAALLPASLPPVFPDLDAVGYLTQARAIAGHARDASSPLAYGGLHWLRTADGRYVSRYPPGLPLLLALAEWFGGAAAMLLLNPLLSSLNIVLLFVAARRWFGDWLALTAATLFAVNPVASGQALHLDAHTLATTLVLASLVAVIVWTRRRLWPWAFLAGSCLGAVVAVRYAEALCAAGAFLVFGARARFDPAGRRALLAALAGAAAPLLALAVYHTVQFGAPWQTGYAFTGEQGAFAWSHLRLHAWRYARTGVAAFGVVLPLGIAGAISALCQPAQREKGLLIAGTVVPVTIAYASYYWFAEIGDSTPVRFLLPTLPAYLLGTLTVLDHWPSSRPRSIAIVSLMLLQLALQLPVTAARLRDATEMAGPGLTILSWAEANIPPGVVVVGDLVVVESLEFGGRWRLANPTIPLGLSCSLAAVAAADASTPVGPLQSGRAVWERVPYAALRCGERTQAILADLVAWAGSPQEVYWLARGSDEADRLMAASPAGSMVAFEPLAEVPLPGRGPTASSLIVLRGREN